MHAARWCSLLLLSVCHGISAQDDPCMTELHHAADIGDSDRVTELLKRVDADIDDACETKIRPLMLAAANGNTDVATLLLEAGATRDVRHSTHGATPLIGAAQGGHNEIVRLLLDHKASVDLKDDLNLTALYYAAQNGHVDTIKMLIAAGAALNGVTHTGVTAFMAAKGNRHKAAAKALVDAGAENGRAHDSVYLTGALPLPLENAKPFEDFLLGAYDFELLIGGGDQAAERLQLKERKFEDLSTEAGVPGSPGSLNAEQKREFEEERAEAWRIASLAITIPTPVYLKRGTHDVRLWFDPTLAVWLVSEVQVPTGTTSQWQERQQFLRAEPLSPMQLDAASAGPWQVRLVAHNRSSGEMNETWVRCPELSLTRGAAGAAAWKRQQKEGYERVREEAKEEGAQKPTAGSVESEIERLRTRAALHPSHQRIASEAQAKAQEQVLKSSHVQSRLREIEKKRGEEYAERTAAKAKDEKDRTAKEQEAKVREIFKHHERQEAKAGKEEL